ncbi:MAG: hypothetical protein O3B72_09115 [Proteobacteria bacterium]|nr:hypothetical protein [Pseudomonadota bacterium]
MKNRLLLLLLSLPLGAFFVAGGVQLFLSGPLGSDYTYFLPRLVYGYFWQVENGFLTVPWFSPAWCGGLPFYPDPQVMFHSIPQWLLWLVDPVQTVFVTYLLFGALGALGMYLLLRQRLQIGTWLSFSGTVLFAFNEFYLFRMMAGHFSYHAYMLLPLVAWSLAGAGQGSRSVAAAHCLFSGLLIAYLIHSGAGNLVLPVLLSVGVILMLHALTQPVMIFRLLACSVLACLVAVSLSAAKLVSAYAFVRSFPRDTLSLGIFDTLSQSFFALVTALFANPWFSLKEIAAGYLVQQQELHFGVTAMPVILLLIGVAAIPRLATRLTVSRVLLILGIVAVMLTPVLLSVRQPELESLLKQLPYFREMSLAIRWVCLLVPLVIMIPLLLVQQAIDEQTLAGRRLHMPVAVLTTGLVLISQSMTERPRDVPYDPGALVSGYQAVRAGGSVPAIDRVTAHPEKKTFVGVDDDFLAGGSSQVCYQPLFGYRLERYPLKSLQTGSIYREGWGFLNFKQPVCYLYPESFSCRPGDHFRRQDSEQLAVFATNQVVDWKRPWFHEVAVWINLVSGLLVVLLLPYLTLRRR